ncbi:MAG: OmpH family outer membrane protein [Lentisphaeria bacterium]|jgi:Skp family chaperone for outer membrane proteins|nr:OmpH family outer membrane protein [Lentisphaeria bacterium]
MMPKRIHGIFTGRSRDVIVALGVAILICAAGAAGQDENDERSNVAYVNFDGIVKLRVEKTGKPTPYEQDLQDFEEKALTVQKAYEELLRSQRDITDVEDAKRNSILLRDTTDTFQELRLSLQELQAQASEPVEKRGGPRMDALREEIRQVIEATRVKEGVDLVLDSGQVIVADKSLDLTAKVLEELEKLDAEQP